MAVWLSGETSKHPHLCVSGKEQGCKHVTSLSTLGPCFLTSAVAGPHAAPPRPVSSILVGGLAALPCNHHSLVCPHLVPSHRDVTAPLSHTHHSLVTCLLSIQFMGDSLLSVAGTTEKQLARGSVGCVSCRRKENTNKINACPNRWGREPLRGAGKQAV